MVMQEGHKKFILVRANDTLHPVWGSDHVLSCTQNTRSRGYMRVRERERAKVNLRGGWVLVWALRLLCCGCMIVCPPRQGLPSLYSLKGRRAFTCVNTNFYFLVYRGGVVSGLWQHGVLSSEQGSRRGCSCWLCRAILDAVDLMSDPILPLLDPIWRHGHNFRGLFPWPTSGNSDALLWRQCMRFDVSHPLLPTVCTVAGLGPTGEGVGSTVGIIPCYGMGAGMPCVPSAVWVSCAES